MAQQIEYTQLSFDHLAANMKNNEANLTEYNHKPIYEDVINNNNSYISGQLKNIPISEVITEQPRFNDDMCCLITKSHCYCKNCCYCNDYNCMSCKCDYNCMSCCKCNNRRIPCSLCIFFACFPITMPMYGTYVMTTELKFMHTIDCLISVLSILTCPLSSFGFGIYGSYKTCGNQDQ
jgi:hypothetical protein